MKKKTFIVQLLDSKKPSRKSFTQVEDANFYSNDTDASLIFIPHEDTFDFQSAKVVMYNRGDESLVERDMVVTTEDERKVASYELPDEIISHWGDWTAQPVFISDGEIYSGSIVPFSVFRYLMHERPPRLNEVVTITKFIQQSQALVDDMVQKEAQRVTQEQERQSAEAVRVQAENERSVKYESYAQQFNDVITDLSEEKDYHSLPEIAGARGGFDTLGERLNDTTAQLAQTTSEARRKRELEDLSPTVLSAIEGGEGTSFDLKTIPQRNSVGLLETKYPMAEGVPSKNIFDGEVELGAYDYSTGKPTPTSGIIRSSNLIKVIKGSEITIQLFNGKLYDIALIFEYDINKNFIKHTGNLSVNATHQLSVNTEYISFQSQSNGTSGYVLPTLDYYRNNVQVVQGSSPLAYESPYPKVGGNSIEKGAITQEKLAKGSVGMSETKYLMAEGTPSSNLFDGVVEYGAFDYSTGKPTPSTNIVRSANPMKVSKGSSITVQTFNGKPHDVAFIFEYNKSMVFIKYTAISATTKTLQLDTDTEYVHFRSQTNGASGYVLPSLDFYKNNIMVEEGTEPSSYVNHLPKVSTKNIAPKSITKELLADDVVIGGGGSQATDKLPSYYAEEKERVIAKVYDDITSPTNSVFGMIADIQSDTGQDNTKNMLEHYTNINYLSREIPVSFIANLGDFINGVSPKETTLSELRKYMNLATSTTPVPYFITKGNHDDNSAYTIVNDYPFDELITNEEWYKYVIKYFERYPQFVFDETNRQGGYCYIDDEASKIRYIFMNSYETNYIRNPDGTSKYDSMRHPAFSNNQLNWLAHEAFNFMDKPDKAEWATVGFAHYIHGSTKNYAMLIDLINAYNSGTEFTATSSLEDYEANVSVDFSQQGEGEFITFFCGDTHGERDFYELIHGIHLITIESSYYPGTKYPLREKGTATQDSFEIVVIDRENKLIKLTNFGGGRDRVLNYANYTPKYGA